MVVTCKKRETKCHNVCVPIICNGMYLHAFCVSLHWTWFMVKHIERSCHKLFDFGVVHHFPSYFLYDELVLSELYVTSTLQTYIMPLCWRFLACHVLCPLLWNSTRCNPISFSSTPQSQNLNLSHHQASSVLSDRNLRVLVWGRPFLCSPLLPMVSGRWYGMGAEDFFMFWHTWFHPNNHIHCLR